MAQQSEPAAFDDSRQASRISGSGVNLLIGYVVEPPNAQNVSKAFAVEDVDALALCGGEGPGLTSICQDGQNAGVQNPDLGGVANFAAPPNFVKTSKGAKRQADAPVDVFG